MAQQVTRSQLKRLSSADAKKIDQVMDQPSMGCALYTDNQGNGLVVSYGTFRAEVPSRYCPSNYGDLALAAFVPPESITGATDGQMVSPLKLAVQHSAETFPQLPTRWHYGGSVTEHPGEHGRRLSPLTIEPEPAPDRRAILQEREPVEKPPPESDEWWDRHFGPPRRG
jgi:hypothetical protein